MGEDRRLIERRVLGYGLTASRLGATGTDVALVRGDDGRRRLAIVEGIEALSQDLHAAFLTGLGTDPLNLRFGFDGVRAISEGTELILLAERIRASAAAVLVREPRVRQVVEVSLRFARESEDRPEANRPTDAAIDCVFETILGRREQVTIPRSSPL